MTTTAAAAADQPEPSGSARLLASNTAWRLIAFGARTFSGVLATVLLAHMHGPVGLGRFQFALTLTLLLSFAVALGLPKLLVRELARHPEAIKLRIESALVVSLGAGVVVTGLLLGVGVLFHGDTSVFVLAGVALAADSAMRIVMVPFWALERMRYEALCVGVQEGAFVVLTVVVLVAGFGPGGVMLAYLVSRVIGLITAWTVVAVKLHIRLVPRWHAGEMAPMMKRATPFALDDALSLAYIRLDTVILGIIIGAHEVGLYQSAVNLVLYLNIMPRMLNFSMYPRMSRAWPDNVARAPATLRLLADDAGRARDADRRRLLPPRPADLRRHVRVRVRPGRPGLPAGDAAHPDPHARQHAGHGPHGRRPPDAAHRRRWCRRGRERRPQPDPDPAAGGCSAPSPPRSSRRPASSRPTSSCSGGSSVPRASSRRSPSPGWHVSRWRSRSCCSSTHRSRSSWWRRVASTPHRCTRSPPS